MDTSVEYAVNYNVGIMCKSRKLNHKNLLINMLDKNIPGDVMEIGSYKGEGSTMVLAAVMHNYQTDKTLYIYDSFEGLPEFHEIDKTNYPGFFKAQGMFKTTQQTLESNISQYNIKKKIFAGWIHDTLPSSLPDQICYAHIDCDLYEPTLFALKNIYEKLTLGSICVIDDYNFPPFPGAKKAVDEFLSDKDEKLIASSDTIQAFFIKE